jgi:hypothetical protein
VAPAVAAAVRAVAEPRAAAAPDSRGGAAG